MKKVFLAVSLIFFAYSIAFSQQRYIVFFAETADLSQNVIDKILISDRFCMVVPVKSSEEIPQKIEELVVCGKIEPSLTFNPEPVFPVLESVYSKGGKKSARNSAFGDFVVDNINSFEDNVNKSQFGIFLDSGEVSNDILSYFASLNVSWINISNSTEKINGAYKIKGINVFSLYKDFPTNQKDVMKWLEGKKDEVIPVLLTKKHLNSVNFMTYLIELFDKSQYIKPAVALYVTNTKKEMIRQNTSVSFTQLSVNGSIMSKLYEAADSINKYRTSSGFNEYYYNNAQSEMLYLCSLDLLKGLEANNVSSVRMFDAAYNNIFRLLGYEIPQASNALIVSDYGENPHTSVKQRSGGITITNSGVINTLSIYASGENTRIDFHIVNAAIGESLSYVDIYIDMNNLDWAGSTTMLSGTNGFLTTDSGWEYAIRINSDKALLYRYSAEGASFVAEVPVNNGRSVSIPQRYLRGNPSNWGFQAVAVSAESGEIVDFLTQLSTSKSSMLSKKPFQIPAVRLK